MGALLQAAYFRFTPYVLGAFGVGILIFVSALAGISTRPEGMLAVLWPANALLLVAFIRVKEAHTPLGWLAAFAGYLAADLITGASPVKAVLYSLPNLASVAVGVYLFALLSAEDQFLKRAVSILYLFLISSAASVAAGLVASVAEGVAMQGDPLVSFMFWASSNFVAFMVILPFALMVPLTRAAWRSGLYADLREEFAVKSFYIFVPAVLLFISVAMVTVVRGPGAVVFPLPALLWCTLTYRLPVVAFLITLIAPWLMAGLEFDMIATVPDPENPYLGTLSLRLGIAMLAFGPLTVAAIDRERSELVDRLAHAAKHDFLTGTLTRGAFMAMGQAMVEAVAAQKGRLSVMVLDLDHFKSINDTYGHRAGDQALIAISKIISANLRDQDLFARLGGEEFSLLLPDMAPIDAQALAHRLRKAVEETHVPTADGTPITITASIGVVSRELDKVEMLENLIGQADNGMYSAKAEGRNRVVAL
ncbi:GGDEF domain-containing protein [Thalassospira lucentensis]|uniref:GGDEF domain-containing protein n=1 Tax=Thalassospira lucentensis TaxID=168935 RepID=UPI00142E667D|nr:GGDEF domain-containing protein [Thalassospira lucentensis]NIZ02667.1 diguanylate cyclase [Thalassospira lucentensis]